jgi:hypothetical protein
MSVERLEDFACSCALTDAGRLRRSLYQCKKTLGATDADFLSRLIMDLEWGLPNNCRAHIDWVACDQWFGVGASVYQGGMKAASIVVQCDQLEYGLARVREMVYEFAQTAS